MAGASATVPPTAAETGAEVQPRVGYTDFLNMPDDGRRYEIHGGELVVVPSPLLLHQIRRRMPVAPSTAVLRGCLTRGT